jgi:hypothetical protein
MKNLKELADFMLETAKNEYVNGPNTTEFPMTYAAQDKLGGLYLIVVPMLTSQAKPHIFSALKLFNVAHEINGYVVGFEAWRVAHTLPKNATAHEVSDHVKKELMPSQHPDRIESLMILSALRGAETHARCYDIKRDGEHAELYELVDDKQSISGNLTELVHPVVPHSEAVRVAREIWTELTAHTKMFEAIYKYDPSVN